MTPQMRVTDCTVREARQRLRSARAYLEAAELILGDDREEYAGVAAGNAVLAGIAAADAICGKGLKKRFRGEDVNAHPKQPHVRTENSHTWLMCKSASGTWPTPLSLRTFWFGTVWWRPEVGNFLPSTRCATA